MLILLSVLCIFCYGFEFGIAGWQRYLEFLQSYIKLNQRECNDYITRISHWVEHNLDR